MALLPVCSASECIFCCRQHCYMRTSASQLSSALLGLSAALCAQDTALTSAQAMSSARSAKAISGSIIQNSAR